MGHANLKNLSRHLTPQLFDKGKVSVKEALASFRLLYPTDGVRASEGVYTEDYMLSEALWTILGIWTGRDVREHHKNPVVLVAESLSDRQKEVLLQWWERDSEAIEHWMDKPWDDPDMGYNVLDSIPFKIAREWLQKCQDNPSGALGAIPQVGSITN